MKKDFILLNIGILLVGLSGLFGKLIDLPSQVIVGGRFIFASLFLFGLIKSKKEKLNLKESLPRKIILVQGVLLFLHSVTFFQGIKMSSVAIGLLSFSSFPIFTTFMEPIFFKEKIKRYKIVIAIITFFGISMVVPLDSLTKKMIMGILYGVTSGFLFAILTLLNSRLSKLVSGLNLTFYQCLGAGIFSLPFLIGYGNTPSLNNFLLLGLLGIVFTGISHSLCVMSLKKIDPSTVSVITCLEPVYGIIFSFFILGEKPHIKVIIGCLIVTISAMISGRLDYSKKLVKKVN